MDGNYIGSYIFEIINPDKWHMFLLTIYIL
jgi:hypothetical protein